MFRNLRWIIFIASLAVFLLLTACGSVVSTSDSRLRVLASVEGARLSAKVYLEGREGQSLSGALVTVVDPGGAFVSLDYDSRKSAYIFEGSVLSGVYEFKVDSLLTGKKLLKVPVKVLNPKPDVVSIKDGLGAKAQEFKALSVSTPIQLIWQSSKGATSYLVEVRQHGETVFSEQTDEHQLILPAATLVASELGSSALLEVTASFQAGDAEFSRQAFFSSTVLAGGSYSFELRP